MLTDTTTTIVHTMRTEQLDDSESSKVFVGEYASSDKNTLAGAVAEAAVMTGFENNSDVVRLAATAPLFNKILTDALTAGLRTASGLITKVYGIHRPTMSSSYLQNISVRM